MLEGNMKNDAGSLDLDAIDGLTNVQQSIDIDNMNDLDRNTLPGTNTVNQDLLSVNKHNEIN